MSDTFKLIHLSKDIANEFGIPGMKVALMGLPPTPEIIKLLEEILGAIKTLKQHIPSGTLENIDHGRWPRSLSQTFKKIVLAFNLAFSNGTQNQDIYHLRSARNIISSTVRDGVLDPRSDPKWDRAPTHIVLSGLNIIELCRRMCRYCSASMLTEGGLMDFELIRKLLDSDQVLISAERGMFLGEGEPILWTNEGYVLGDVTALLVDYGYNLIELTTAGLVECNLDPGKRNLESLAANAAHLDLNLSFNLMGPEDEAAYIDSIKRTLELLNRIGISPRLLAMSEPEDEPTCERTSGAVDLLRRNFSLVEIESRGPSPLGRYRGGNLEPSTCDVLDIIDRGEIGVPIRDINIVAVRPRGIVMIGGCKKPGIRGAVLGSVYEHDARGIAAAYKRFLGHHRGSCGRFACKAHGNYGRNFGSAQRSSRPIVRAA